MTPNERRLALGNLIIGDRKREVKNYFIRPAGKDVFEVIVSNPRSGTGLKVEAQLSGAMAAEIAQTFDSMPARIADIYMFGVLHGAKLGKTLVFA
jgi:hypothetical protein